ncbi:FoF1 ATP synthase subunit delta/epsilon [Abyssalbus ytuae]|uniref:F0F1 ATP synthase subunit epsilon n=1 Tax=Abyssalbus ytuae TaxID=2926907 RepID=A0A9E7CTI1_9FLAO|nr:F0F1 ATP synthase subunit epsilon [Abyssalbus ytuae]UOB16212.1 F0F1 ATP synthase subunit epsilon [Abyssalbus ytuae]
MYLEIVTPEATLFNGDVESVAVPGINGEFQMLNNHAPIVSLLGKGNVKIYGDMKINKEFSSKFTKGDKNVTLLSINSGTVEMKDNKVIVLAD